MFGENREKPRCAGLFGRYRGARETGRGYRRDEQFGSALHYSQLLRRAVAFTIGRHKSV